ncbi:MAG: RT0821/Lpp0805 family surface protein, partial [Arenicellales bacterium]|nr:RT0821/Lpp0805 family surface protein [Arenicellales bacterium]
SAIGKDLDERDKQLMNNNFQNTLEYSKSGEQSGWSNPDSGHSGTTVAKPATQSTTVGYEYCREFTTTVNVAGEDQQGYGTACRKPDGSWEIQ